MNTQDGGGRYEHGVNLDKEPTWVNALHFGACVVVGIMSLVIVCGMAGWIYALTVRP